MSPLSEKLLAKLGVVVFAGLVLEDASREELLGRYFRAFEGTARKIVVVVDTNYNYYIVKSAEEIGSIHFRSDILEVLVIPPALWEEVRSQLPPRDVIDVSKVLSTQV